MMERYHKIQTVYLRDPDNKYKTLLVGQFATPEFKYLAENEWTFTEKVDGTNIRVDWDCERVLFGGRTDNAQIPTFLFAKLQELFPPDKFRMLYPELPMTLYGEGYGAKIQKGGGNYIPDGVSFVLFDIMISGNYQDRDSVKDIAQHLGIDTVPIVGHGTLPDAVEMARSGFESRWGEHTAEGLVMRPSVELVTRTGKRIISKIKHKDFERS
jgi:ATP-dependent RNA circularization protein (DNA/RNA ligase family)